MDENFDSKERNFLQIVVRLLQFEVGTHDAVAAACIDQITRCNRSAAHRVLVAAEKKLHAAWPIPPGEVFDKTKYEEVLTKLQLHQEQIFGELPLHYETVGHWLQPDSNARTVDVLLDFK